MGAEDHLLAVGRPAQHLVVVAGPRRHVADVVVEGELARRAAVDADHVDLAVAAVLAGEGDPLAVGRELGEELEAGMRSEAAGQPAGRVDHPDVPGVDEGDGIAMDVGVAQQARVARAVRPSAGRGGGEGGDEREQKQDGGGEEPKGLQAKAPF